MPDNLRITAPIPSEQGIAKPESAPGAARAVPVSPLKLPQAETGDGRGGRTGDLILSRNTVFGEFIRQLGQTQDLGRTLERIAAAAASRSGPAGESPRADSPVFARFEAGMKMDAEGIFQNLVAQQKDVSFFSGPFFRYFDALVSRKEDPQLDLRTAAFLRAFSGYFSAPDVRKAIFSNLNSLENEIPAAYAEKIRAAAEKLPTEDIPAEDFAESVQKGILPLLKEYMEKISDYGKPRDDISLLINNLAILESGSRANLVSSFSELLRYCKSVSHLGEKEAGILQELFQKTLLSRQDWPESDFFKSLVPLLSLAEGKEGKDPDKAALRDLCSSLLLDNSVFMPFFHLFLPARIGGRSFFTEIWIEKKDPEPKKGISGIRPSRVYLSFTIQNLGYFEASLNVSGRKVDLFLSFPPVLSRFRGQIRSDLADILMKSGLQPGSVRTGPLKSPQIPGKIREKIYERKQTVDVTV